MSVQRRFTREYGDVHAEVVVDVGPLRYEAVLFVANLPVAKQTGSRVRADDPGSKPGPRRFDISGDGITVHTEISANDEIGVDWHGQPGGRLRRAAQLARSDVLQGARETKSDVLRCDTLVARSILVVDDEGKPRVQVYSDEEGNPTLRLTAAHRTVHVSLSAEDASITIVEDDSDSVLFAALGGESATAVFAGSDGEPIAGLSLSQDGTVKLIGQPAQRKAEEQKKARQKDPTRRR